MFRFAASETRLADPHGGTQACGLCAQSRKQFGILRCLPISGLQTRWAHRLETYGPLMRAYRRKHPMFIPASKITPMCWKTST